jgi:hypothetical protein
MNITQALMTASMIRYCEVVPDLWISYLGEVVQIDEKTHEDVGNEPTDHASDIYLSDMGCNYSEIRQLHPNDHNYYRNYEYPQGCIYDDGARFFPFRRKIEVVLV